MSREELARRFDMRLLKIFIGFAWAILGLFVTADRAYAVFPGVNGKIVFVGNQSGTWQLYTVNGDGSGLNLPVGDDAAMADGVLRSRLIDARLRIRFYRPDDRDAL